MKILLAVAAIVAAFSVPANSSPVAVASQSNAWQVDGGHSSVVFKVKHANASQNNVTIDPNGAELIDGNATLVLTARQSAYIQSDGTAWHVLARA